MIRPTAYQRQLPMDELLEVARAELKASDTITTYVMVNGAERRKIANPLARLQRIIDELTTSIASLIGIDLRFPPTLEWPTESGCFAELGTSPYTLSSVPFTPSNRWGGYR